MPTKNLTQAIWQGKCPRCREGRMFKTSAFHITRFGMMNATCPQCGANFEPETGFYFGAMFISYAINVAIFIGVWLFLYLLIDPADWIYIVSISVSALLATPFTYRISRILWLYWFGGLTRR